MFFSREIFKSPVYADKQIARKAGETGKISSAMLKNIRLSK